MSTDNTDRRLEILEATSTRHSEELSRLTERIGDSENGIVASIKDLKGGQAETNRELEQIKKLLWMGMFLLLGKEGLLHLLKI